eukprot:753915-Hanusia_phi.AAC.23
MSKVSTAQASRLSWLSGEGSGVSRREAAEKLDGPRGSSEREARQTAAAEQGGVRGAGSEVFPHPMSSSSRQIAKLKDKAGQPPANASSSSSSPAAQERQALPEDSGPAQPQLGEPATPGQQFCWKLMGEEERSWLTASDLLQARTLSSTRRRRAAPALLGDVTGWVTRMLLMLPMQVSRERARRVHKDRSMKRPTEQTE